MKLKDRRIVLAFSIIVCLIAGVVGSVFTTPSISTWYATLAKPSFSPPSWIFGPVWTTLYVLIGISLYLMINKKKLKKVRLQVSLFGVQLALNVAWSFLFFGLRSPLLGFAEITVLWIAIAATIVSFYRIDKRAAYLLLPYIIWVSIASVLNYFVWMLN